VTACSAPPRPEGLVIRDFRSGDEPALRDVFFTSVHALAGRDYRPAQLAVWAPREHDPAAWAARLQANRPFVAELDGIIAGFADLGEDGYIDQFFVAGGQAGRGVGRALMAHLLDVARRRHLPAVWANVSLRAEAFFAHHGFVVAQRQMNTRHGVALPNARMHLPLQLPFPADAPGHG
jgi:putative acetyltransferase